MTKISQITNLIEEFAPLSLASSWDNSGWQIYLGDKDINKVMIALTPTVDIISSAIEQKIELLIAHHPLMFNKINKLNINNYENLAVINAIKGNLQIYSAHTNLDSAENGIADKLAQMLELKNLSPIEKITNNTGLGRIGELEKPVSLDSLIQKIKQILNISTLKVINPSNKSSVRTIGLCPGSGGDFISSLKNVDLYITADIKYHTALEVNDLVVIDAGHLETERIILPVLKNLIEKTGISAIIAEENAPWQLK